MAAKKLTEKRIRSLKSKAKRYDVFDPDFRPGSFAVRVSRTGLKSFRVCWRQDGGRHSKTLGTWPATSLGDARLRARKVVSDAETGHHDPRARKLTIPTLKDYFEGSFRPAFVENPGTIRPSTREQYLWAFDKHILRSDLAGRRLDQIERAHLEKWIAVLVDSDLSRGSIETLIKCLRRLFNWAIDHQVVKSHPVRKLSILYRQVGSRSEGFEPWNSGQIRSFLQAARQFECGRHYVLFLVLLQTGLRIGEALALRWRDLDLSRARLSVERTYSHGSLNTPKTEAGRRVVDLPQSLVQELKSHRLEVRTQFFQKGRSVPQLLFPNTRGGLWELHNLRNRVFYPLVKSSGVPRLSIHQLRDCYASQLLMTGAPVSYVAQQLGHKDPRVTVTHYAKWIPGEGREFLRVLEARVSGG